MNNKINLGDLWQDLANPFDEDMPAGAIEDICFDASIIIGKLDEWVTQKRWFEKARASGIGQPDYEPVQWTEDELMDAIK